MSIWRIKIMILVFSVLILNGFLFSGAQADDMLAQRLDLAEQELLLREYQNNQKIIGELTGEGPLVAAQPLKDLPQAILKTYQDDNQKIEPVKPLEVVRAPKKVFKKISPALDSIQRERKVLNILELRDMDIKDVLKLISSKTGLNIVAGNSVSGRVTVYLKDVEVFDALRIILDANDLAFAEDNGIIRVMPAAEYEAFYGRKFGQQIETEVIALKGLKATDVVALLERMKSSVGKIVADTKLNTIMISDIPSKLEMMREYLSYIDQPLRYKAYDLRFVQVESVAGQLQNFLTPGLGVVTHDVRSNKVFVKDIEDVIDEITVFIEEIDVPRATEVFALSYAKAEDIALTVEKVLTQGIGQVEYDTRSNQVIVMDTLPKLNEISEMIFLLDDREGEVLVEAKILQVTLTDEFRMGVDWETLFVDEHNLGLKSAFSNVSATPEVGQFGRFKVGVLDTDEYTFALEALSDRGNTRVLSNPRIAVVNNEEAKILVGTNRPYVTSSTTLTDGNATTAEAINYVDVGVKLFVTPQIHNDDYITMKIKPEVSSAPSDLETSQGNFIPIVETSEVETTVRVKDGVTIVIGGLIKEEESDNRKQVPVLGSIPVVGRAFRSEDKTTEKTEIVIFLTPRIISGDLYEYTQTVDF